MRYMIIVKATEGSEAGVLPDDTLIDEMGQYHEALASAGVLLEGMGLHPSREGWRIEYTADGQRRVVDGPFAESKELMAGFTLIQVRSAEEALEWSRRFPAPHGAGQPAQIEVRRVMELEALGPAEQMDRFRELGLGE